MNHFPTNIHPKDFGPHFTWGVAMAAAQNEGAWNEDGRGPSIWDVFARRQGKIKGKGKPYIATDFYHRFKDDLLLVKALGFNSFRFSIAWSRIMPDGAGKVNQAGLNFYHQLIDECLSQGITPFVTLYHWDLPYALEQKGGWTSHLMNRWFIKYATVCANAFGDKVKNWIVLNEPFGFTSLGYMLGRHAPGKTGLDNFLKAVHHAALAQADGGRVLRAEVKNAYIGTSFSCSEVRAFSQRAEDIEAARKTDILLNRLFIEPLLGKGYPNENMKLLEKLELVNKAWKFTERLRFDMDFIGLQNYFPVTVKHSPFIPYVNATEVKAVTRKVPHTAMGWEISAGGFYNIIKKFWKYGAVKEIIITESGAAFTDKLVNGQVDDQERIQYHQQYLQALLQAKKEGVKIKGYMAWTLTDNFEWSEGYHPRFGLVHVDFKTQLRTVKQSGYWFRDFLNKE
ncbi:MAG TPA: GH1 family beta-glucosidase [Chitinophagaceae bacterium]|nr:GH1 family beta-glucosidase [Chitinophagaceae bacterium]